MNVDKEVCLGKGCGVNEAILLQALRQPQVLKAMCEFIRNDLRKLCFSYFH
jgi:hypothetical protein